MSSSGFRELILDVYCEPELKHCTLVHAELYTVYGHVIGVLRTQLDG
jgi:hypothetical protein